MIIMKTDATQEQIDQVVRTIEKYGLRADVSKGEHITVIGPVGDERKLPFDSLGFSWTRNRCDKKCHHCNCC